MKRATALGASLAVALASSIACAQSAPDRRIVGFGGGLGFGLESNTVPTTNFTLLAPTIELRVPVTPRLELAAWVPVTNVVFANFGSRQFAWFDVFATWYPLRDAGGFFVAPGLGFVYGASPNSSGVGVQIPGRVGWEWTTTHRGVGFSLDLRPWAELVIPSGNVDIGARYGAFIEFNIIGYVTRAR